MGLAGNVLSQTLEVLIPEVYLYACVYLFFYTPQLCARNPWCNVICLFFQCDSNNSRSARINKNIQWIWRVSSELESNQCPNYTTLHHTGLYCNNLILCSSSSSHMFYILLWKVDTLVRFLICTSFQNNLSWHLFSLTFLSQRN